MKVAVSAQGPYLDSEVDLSMGSCLYLVIVDMETMGFEAMKNAEAELICGADIEAARMIADKDIKTVLTGECDLDAQDLLYTNGIEVVTGVSGSIRSAVESYKAGRLQAGVKVASTTPSMGASVWGEEWVGACEWTWDGGMD